ncbi:hypothetical protein CWI39_2066p0010 [Hamiltosporidium magnivora]|uniref:GIT Spa2 homology (SHD) domain-containing protein n=1 Tax=Hamiltosporidium magnivora TaxID=148818 RepID=A0A4Q9L2K6_9MICR|nr:hypothetical protein CWI39_2066p0010 [Hamiltosporidium magnivora]TBU01255.1 hypothetical protein CWI36_1394p0020 [Hamiltosporidium magnivora]
MENYLGSFLKDINITERQKEAISKMLFLNEMQFKDLIEDLSDELERRKDGKKDFLETKNKYTVKRNDSRKRLAKLTENKFKNLVLDTYLVMNHRRPNEKFSDAKEIDTLIFELEKMIKTLKKQKTYEDSVIENIQDGGNIRLKSNIYNEYVRNILIKHNEDLSVVNYMEKIFNEHIHKLKKDEFLTLFDTNEFIGRCDNIFYEIRHFEREYEYHKNNILSQMIVSPSVKNLSELNTNNEFKNYVITNEMIQICRLLFKVNEYKKLQESESSLSKEINGLICCLEAIKEGFQTQKDDQCYIRIAINVNEIAKSFERKISKFDFVDHNHIKNLSNHQKNLENFIEANKDISNLEESRLFETFPNMVFNIADIFKQILNEIPGENDSY